jgi:hypothetical protein
VNIFYLDPDPKICAEMHVSKHVVKMIIEYAQLMSTAHRVLDGTQYTDLTANGRRIQRWRMSDPVMESTLYKASHINHPSAIWCRENKENYVWLYRMWFYLLQEYTYRYGRQHECAKLRAALYLTPENIPDGKFFTPTPAMPQELKIVAENPVPGRKYDSLKSYHNYYIKDKIRFASWKGKINSRNIPDWFQTA